MTIESGLRNLRLSSLVVTVFAIVFLLAGLAEIGLGAMAVSEEYDRIAEVEKQAHAANPYSSYRRSAAEMQYNQSSSAFLGQGRFLPSLAKVGWDSPSAIAGIALLVSAFGFLFASLAWVWRAHANLAGLGIRTKYGPGMAVAGFIIPVANLVLPFEAMRELYNRSHGEAEELVSATVDDVTAWWTAVVVGLLIFSILMVKFTLDLGTNLIIMTPLWMEFAIAGFAVLLLLVSAMLFAGLARKITHAQQEVLPQIDPVAAQETAPQRGGVSLS